MTLGRFTGMVEEMSIILNNENGSTPEKNKPLSGEIGFKVLQSMVPGQRSKR